MRDTVAASHIQAEGRQGNMIKLLLVVFWLLFYIIDLADGILCSNCELEYPGKFCEKPRWSCRLSRGYMCFKETLFHGTMPIYSKKGCRKNCKSVAASMLPTYISQEILCCASGHFCNR